MKLIFLVLILAALAFAAEEQQNLCDLTLWDPSLVPLFPSTPQPWPAGALKVCPPSVTSTGDTCCTTAVFEQIKYLFENISNTIQDVENDINTFWGNLATTLQDWWNSLTAQQKQAIRNADPNIDAQIQDLENFIKNFPTDFAVCIHALFRYWLGMFCLVCSDDPLQYFDTNTSPITVSIAEATCTHVYDACNPLIQLIVTVQSVNSQNTPSTGPLCTSTSTCQTFICNNFISGTNTNVNGIVASKKKAILAMTGLEQSGTFSNTYCTGSNCYYAYATGQQSDLSPGAGYAVRPLIAFVFFLVLVALLL